MSSNLAPRNDVNLQQQAGGSVASHQRQQQSQSASGMQQQQGQADSHVDIERLPRTDPLVARINHELAPQRHLSMKQQQQLADYLEDSPACMAGKSGANK